MPVISFGLERRHYKWHQWELELLNYLKQEGKSTKELAQIFGVPVYHLMATFKRHGFRTYYDWKAERQNLIDLLEKGYSPKKIAETYDVETRQISLVFERHQIPYLPPEIETHVNFSHLHLSGHSAERPNASLSNQ